MYYASFLPFLDASAARTATGDTTIGFPLDLSAAQKTAGIESNSKRNKSHGSGSRTNPSISLPTPGLIPDPELVFRAQQQIALLQQQQAAYLMNASLFYNRSLLDPLLLASKLNASRINFLENPLLFAAEAAAAVAASNNNNNNNTDNLSAFTGNLRNQTENASQDRLAAGSTSAATTTSCSAGVTTTSSSSSGGSTKASSPFQPWRNDASSSSPSARHHAAASPAAAAAAASSPDAAFPVQGHAPYRTLDARQPPKHRFSDIASLTGHNDSAATNTSVTTTVEHDSFNGLIKQDDKNSQKYSLHPKKRRYDVETANGGSPSGAADIRRLSSSTHKKLSTSSKKAKLSSKSSSAAHIVGSAVSSGDSHDDTLLQKAARLGNTEMVVFCLERGDYDVNAKGRNGLSALHDAASRGHVPVARALLCSGANVDDTDTSGFTPLHEACRNGHMEMCRLLLAYGASPFATALNATTPVMLAASHPKIGQLLRGFLADVVDEDTDIAEEKRWRFCGTASSLDDPPGLQSGFDVLGNAPPQGEPLDKHEPNSIPTYRYIEMIDNVQVMQRVVRVEHVSDRLGVDVEDVMKKAARLIWLESGRDDTDLFARTLLTTAQVILYSDPIVQKALSEHPHSSSGGPKSV